MSEVNLLEQSAKFYQTDKQLPFAQKPDYHGYTTVYENLFGKDRLKYQLILELGVEVGRSILMFGDYFSNGIIIGLDNFSWLSGMYHADNLSEDELKKKVIGVIKNLQRNPRIKIIVGSQDDESLFNQLFADNSIDIVVDDASHHSTLSQLSLKYLFPKVKPGGIYIVEDMATAYNPEYRESDDFRCTIISYLQSLQAGKPFSFYIDHLDNVESVEIVGQLGIIRKKS